MNVFLGVLKYSFFNLILDIFYFPIWWYTLGLKKFLIFIKNTIKDVSQALVIKILLVNLFKPMFGQYDRAGRIISFFMRCIHLGINLFLFTLSLIGLLLLFVLWLALPIFSLYQVVLLIIK